MKMWEVNNWNESDSMEKIVKQSNPKEINLLRKKGNVETIRF